LVAGHIRRLRVGTNIAYRIADFGFSVAYVAVDFRYVREQRVGPRGLCVGFTNEPHKAIHVLQYALAQPHRLPRDILCSVAPLFV
jgi:hypothetical protein